MTFPRRSSKAESDPRFTTSTTTGRPILNLGIIFPLCTDLTVVVRTKDSRAMVRQHQGAPSGLTLETQLAMPDFSCAGRHNWGNSNDACASRDQRRQSESETVLVNFRSLEFWDRALQRPTWLGRTSLSDVRFEAVAGGFSIFLISVILVSRSEHLKSFTFD